MELTALSRNDGWHVLKSDYSRRKLWHVSCTRLAGWSDWFLFRAAEPLGYWGSGMRKFGWAALWAAGALAVASSAGATIVRYDLSGGFYYVNGPSTWAPKGGCPGSSTSTGCISVSQDGAVHADYVSGSPWTLSFTIDTDLGHLTRTPLADAFEWTSADGASPLLAGAFVFPATGLDVDLLSATELSIGSSTSSQFAPTSGFGVVVSGPDFTLEIRNLFPGATPPNLTEDAVMGPALNNPYSSFNIGDFNGGYSAGGRLSITNLSAPVPEPSTWAMMLLGFFGLGVALRAQSRSRGALA